MPAGVPSRISMLSRSLKRITNACLTLHIDYKQDADGITTAYRMKIIPSSILSSTPS